MQGDGGWRDVGAALLREGGESRDHLPRSSKPGKPCCVKGSPSGSASSISERTASSSGRHCAGAAGTSTSWSEIGSSASILQPLAARAMQHIAWSGDHARRSTRSVLSRALRQESLSAAGRRGLAPQLEPSGRNSLSGCDVTAEGVSASVERSRRPLHLRAGSCDCIAAVRDGIRTIAGAAPAVAGSVRIVGDLQTRTVGVTWRLCCNGAGVVVQEWNDAYCLELVWLWPTLVPEADLLADTKRSKCTPLDCGVVSPHVVARPDNSDSTPALRCMPLMHSGDDLVGHESAAGAGAGRAGGRTGLVDSRRGCSLRFPMASHCSLSR